MYILYKSIINHCLIKDEDHDLFETSLLESSGTQLVSSGLSIHEHEPTTSTFHIQSSPSDNAYDPTTSLTSNVVAAEDGSTHTPSKALSDEELCTAFVQKTCGCTKANGKPCSTLFPVEHYIQHRAQASLLTRQELDLVLLGSIMTTVLDRDSIVDGRHIPAKRRKLSSCHMHRGYSVCKSTYAFLYGVGTKHRLESIKKHYIENGMETRVHKNTRRLPHNALSFTEITSVVKFIENYAEQHAILLPGRIPSYKRDDMKLLPSSTSKMVTHSMQLNTM